SDRLNLHPLAEGEWWQGGPSVWSQTPNEPAFSFLGSSQAKLVRYICKQQQCKLSVAPGERTSELNSYPRFSDWLCTFNVRPEVVQEILNELTLDALLDMNEVKVKETLRRYGANAEECGRLQYALACLRKVTGLGSTKMTQAGVHWTPGGKVARGLPRTPSRQPARPGPQGAPSWAEWAAVPRAHAPSCIPLHASGRLTPRALHSFITPPTTPQLRRHTKLKPPRTPPPPSRKVFQLLPSFPTLTRSKSHESQLGNRIDEVSPMSLLDLDSFAEDLPYGSPQRPREHFPVSTACRFSTKSWLSQVCHVCQKSMMFGVKCKHCRLKCHNKCTKEAPACRISFLPQPRLRRTESVPSDINNPVDRAAEPHFGTLPKALTKKEHPPAMNHLDSSSNPSSTTSSTPSSPAPFPTSSNPSSATTPPNPSPGQRDSRFNFPDISAFPQAAPSPDAADSRWHGEVAIRLLEMDGHNQDHLKLFKKEVMNYRQTRHENVVLFMGACMNPPHLAIITR
uniref:Phorbol-ester/DAG-type domain-containing protein n=1 Tax=Panthera tigris altaica TaxID=74533 RepID=A0A8C9MEM7_PANTA